MAFDPFSATQASVFDPSTAQIAEQAYKEDRDVDVLNSRDPDIDYQSGIKNFGFRSGFSRMANEAEKGQYLDKSVGPGNWGKDSFGAYFVTPPGLQKLGISSQLPISIDEQSATRYDIADIASDALPLAGAIGAGMLTGGMGALPSIGSVALGGAFGRSIDEIYKNIVGEQVASSGEVAGRIAKEGALAATGEGVTRALRPFGRFILGPGSSRMTPAKQELMESAIEQGFKPRPAQITDSPLLARWEGLVKNIFGDLNEQTNSAATKAAVARLGSSQKLSVEEVGAAVRQSLIGSRRALSTKAKGWYDEVDAIAGKEIIPTARLKAVAQEILDSLPKTTQGRPVFASDKTVGFLDDISNLPDRLTASGMQEVRTTLREASLLKNLTPDLGSRHRRLLRDAADAAFDDVSSMDDVARSAVNKLRIADANYKREIAKFDNKLATAISREPGKVNSIEPELVVDSIIRPGQATKVARIKAIVSPEVWGQVKGVHAEDLLSKVVQKTDDPATAIFNGRAFRDALDKYGSDTLTAVHGSKWTADAYAFANALMIVQKDVKAFSGGIVAANIALNPITHLPKLAFLRTVARLMQQPGTLDYLTKGIKAPRTREGIEALTRVATQASLLAHDETGSAIGTVTDPPSPVMVPLQQ